MQTAILAGGLGTRLGRLTQTVPKPMVRVNGKPFLEHEIGLLKRSGIGDFVLCVGHLGEKVEDYFGNGSKWGVRVRYSYDGLRLMGPAGALKGAEPLLEECFFVTYGDAYLRADYRSIMRALLDSGRLGLMTVYKNHNRLGKSDVVVRGGYVVRYDKEGRDGGMDWVNFGVSALRKRALALVPSGKKCGEEEFYGELIKRNELLAFPVEERFYEIGSPGALKEFKRFISSQP
ncbi:MAG: sugar phosphate nucleotidyltransferase [Nitrososphaerales archaeon]